MYNQRDVLIVPIPFTDLTAAKKRPVLVLSNNNYNSDTEDILVAAITSNLAMKKYSIPLTNDDMENGYLPAVSIVRADKIYSLSRSIAVKKCGVVNEKVFESVIQKLNELVK